MYKIESGKEQQVPVRKKLDQKRRELRNLRLLLVLPFAATAILLALLALVNKDSEVEISLKVSQISFVLGEPKPASLIDPIKTDSLNLQRYEQLDLGAGVLEIKAKTNPNNNALLFPPRQVEGDRILIKPSVNHASVWMKGVTLDHLDTKPRSFVTLKWIEDKPNCLRVSMDDEEVSGGIRFSKSLYLSCDYCEIDSLSFEGQFLLFKSEREQLAYFSARSGLAIDLVLPSGTKLIERDIYIEKDMKFNKQEGNRMMSTIIDTGKIRFEEMKKVSKDSFEEKKKEVKVQVGDFVTLDDLKGFIIKELKIDNGINITLHGRIGKLETGPAGSVKNRLPSLLEWLSVNQTWMLYINALILIGTTILAVLERLKFVPEKK